VVDEHAWARAGVARVHIERRPGPVLLSGNGLAVGASRVPASNSARVEAARRDTSIGSGSLVQIRVHSRENILVRQVSVTGTR
jgi:hypothetical protein